MATGIFPHDPFARKTHCLPGTIDRRPERGEVGAKVSKGFISCAESLLDLFMKKLTENGGVCADCKKRVGELHETLKERIRDKKLEKLELELEIWTTYLS